jgi:hypothetical protein
MKLGNLKLFDPINREHNRNEFLQQSDQIMKTNGLKPKPERHGTQRRTHNGSRNLWLTQTTVPRVNQNEGRVRRKILGEERMAWSSKSQDPKCQRVVENPIARGQNLAGNGAHGWQAEMLSGKRNSLPQTSIRGKSQPAEKRSRNA